MFQKILIPLDGSRRAEQVLHAVSPFLRIEEAELHLLVVVDMQGPVTKGIVPITCSGHRADRYLEELTAMLHCDGLRVRTDVRFGHAAERILDHARDLKAGLIAMSTHGRSGLRRLVRGSVAEEVLRASDIPVLLLRTPGEDDWAEVRVADAPRRIVVPLDGTTDSESVLPYVRHLAGRSGAIVEVLHAISPMPQSVLLPQPSREAIRTGAEEYARDICERLCGDGVRAEPLVAEGWPAEVILDRAQKEGVDLVAMTTHGRSGARRWILGSVAEEVLRSIPVPIFLNRVCEPVPASHVA